jgi:uncharacterized repeat protein (TIGR03803 family)
MVGKRSAIMEKALQLRGWISGTRQRTANAALTFAVLIVPTVVVPQSLQAQSFSVLYSFTPSDGENRKSSLVLDKEGNLYGTAGDGGGSIGFGEVFKLDPAGTETVLHSFNGADGIDPNGGLVRDQEGNLYGTTWHGGASGAGTVFKLDTTGTETVLHSFTGPDGLGPDAGLVLDQEGNLYGTTSQGGSSDAGTVFKLDGTGTETVLHSFTGLDGAGPFAGLVRDREGNLYGTTSRGGTSGLGTVFKVDRTGAATVLHSFIGPDGAGPLFAGLVRDKAGNLYGTTAGGGASGGGTVFKVDTTGTETVLHSFTGGADGAYPAAGLVLDNAGNLYGTTFFGTGGGKVFKLDPAGTETVLHSFTGADGGGPEASLILDKEGNNLYGTTDVGTSGDGTVFKLRLEAPHRER